MLAKSLIIVAPRKVWVYISVLTLPIINIKIVVKNVSPVIKAKITQKCGSTQAACADLLSN